MPGDRTSSARAGPWTAPFGSDRIRGVFVTHPTLLSGRQGGAQVCTAEYIEALRLCGCEVEPVTVSGDRSLRSRIAQRLIPGSLYSAACSKRDVRDVMQRVADAKPDVIFLNQVNLAPIARVLKQDPTLKAPIVLLSHGAEIQDLLHLTRLKERLPLSGRTGPITPWLLGSTLRDEAASRQYCDGVITLSPFDAEFERWLGARCVRWLPRTIQAGPLSWKPRGDRLGYVGTLDHGPNLDGLVAVLDALQRSGGRAEIRIAGGPVRLGEWVSSRFPAASYLGPLDDAELRAEASSWNAFIHPIFLQARGCSTKLATALGWKIPIVTTPLGRRGYLWKHGSLVECETPSDFAAAMIVALDIGRARQWRALAEAAADSSPTIQDVAGELKAALEQFSKVA